MKILGMWLQNYASFHGRHYFNFADRGIALIMGRNRDDPRSSSNGSGKSTLVEAPEWCLFGEVPRDDTADSVVNDAAGKGLCVTVQIIDDDGQLIQVQRLRDYPKHKNGPRLWINGKEITKLDDKETQKDIEKFIGLDRQVWRSAVFFAQNETFVFADATDAQQKQVLTKVLQLEELDEWATTLTTKLAQAEARLPGIDSQRSVLLGEIQNCESQNPEANAAAWEAQLQQNKALLTQQLQHADAEVTRTAQALAPAQVPPPPKPPPASFDNVYQNELSALSTTITQVTQDLGQARGRYADASKKLKALHEKGTGTCNECGQPITASHIAQETQRFQTYLAEVETTGKSLAAQLAELEAKRTSLQAEREVVAGQYRQQQQQYSVAQAIFQKDQQEANARTQAHNHALHAKNTLVSQWNAMHQQQNPYTALTAQYAARVQAARAKLLQVDEERAAVEQGIEHLRFWKVGFGAKGLKSYVLDSRLEEMTVEVNRWVHLLTGGTVWVRFETQKQVGAGSKKKLTDTFNIRVFRHNPDGTITSRNFRSWSGGEKHRIALGIDFGLARLVANRAKRSYDLLVLDEVFQKSLDYSGKEAVAELLLHLAKEKSTILVVDHDVMFQGLFEETIVVEKMNGRSRVITGENDVTAQPSDPSSLLNVAEVFANHPAFPKA